MSLKLSVGADPEMFVEEDGRFVSAYGLIKGDKANPTPVVDGAVQVDGMALEFNINPANDEEEFLHNIQSVLSQMEQMVPTYKVMAVPVAHFGEEYIKKQPEKARELGCDPDFNAYTGDVNDIPDAELPFRTGAGHVHLGWGDDADENPAHFDTCCAIVKQLDLYLGLPSVLFDKEKQRRSMYGKAGAFRPKSYGVEYRVLSNHWVQDVGLRSWVFKNTIAAVRRLEDGDRLFEQVDMDEVVDVINNSNEERARELCSELKIPLPEGV